MMSPTSWRRARSHVRTLRSRSASLFCQAKQPAIADFRDFGAPHAQCSDGQAVWPPALVTAGNWSLVLGQEHKANVLDRCIESDTVALHEALSSRRRYAMIWPTVRQAGKAEQPAKAPCLPSTRRIRPFPQVGQSSLSATGVVSLTTGAELGSLASTGRLKSHWG